MKSAIKTKHKLAFYSRPWRDHPFIEEFKIGTCNGQWQYGITGLEIISIINNVPGNGHLEDVFQWFEYAAARDKKPLIIREFFNDRFKTHSISKRLFRPIKGTDNVVKHFA